MTEAIRSGDGVTSTGGKFEIFTLSNSHLAVSICTLGATVTSLKVPDRNGVWADVVLGFDSVDDYTKQGPYFGCIVGRVANRIEHGKFKINDQEYALSCNNGPNHLHGGDVGFDKKIWSAQLLENGIKLSLESPDGDQGYPGKVSVSAVYRLVGNTIELDMTAEADSVTPVNLAQHSYFNLAGHASGSVLGHRIRISADKYTPVDAHSIPTREALPVAGTPFDFREETLLGTRMEALAHSLKVPAHFEGGLLSHPLSNTAPGGAGSGSPIGFDHNFIVRGDGGAGALRHVADVADPASGRTLTIRATAPGVQFYTGNFLDGGTAGKGGFAYAQHAGLCLETQHFPDSIGADPATEFGRGACPLAGPGAAPYAHSVRYTFGLQVPGA